MNETDWDRLCAKARTLPATIADELAIRDGKIGDLKAALDDVLGEVAWLSKRVAELETALEPLAAVDNFSPADDVDRRLCGHLRLTVGDVLQARRLLGEDGNGLSSQAI